MKLNEFRNKCSLTKRKFAAVFSSFTSYIVRKLHQYSPYFCIDYFIIFICFTPPALSPPTQKQKQRKKCVRLKLTETIQNQSFFWVIFFKFKNGITRIYNFEYLISMNRMFFFAFACKTQNPKQTNA